MASNLCSRNMLTTWKFGSSLNNFTKILLKSECLVLRLCKASTILIAAHCAISDWRQYKRLAWSCLWLLSLLSASDLIARKSAFDQTFALKHDVKCFLLSFEFFFFFSDFEIIFCFILILCIRCFMYLCIFDNILLSFLNNMFICLFVVLRPSQQLQSINLTTCFLVKLRPKRLTST